MTGLFDKQSKGNRILRKLVGRVSGLAAGSVRDDRPSRVAVGAVEETGWMKNRDQINDVIRAFTRVGNFIKDIVTT